MTTLSRNALLAPPQKIDLPGFMLRPWSIGDAAPLRAALLASDAHLRRWTPWVVDGRVPGMSLEDRLAQHQANFTDGTEWVYGLFSPEGSRVLGGCGLYPRVGPRAVELGYWLAAGHTGRGLATQAAAALTGVAFTGDSVDHVEIRCEVENTASARVPARLNYRPMEIVTDGTTRLQVWRLSRSDFVGRPASMSS